MPYLSCEPPVISDSGITPEIKKNIDKYVNVFQKFISDRKNCISGTYVADEVVHVTVEFIEWYNKYPQIKDIEEIKNAYVIACITCSNYIDEDDTEELII